MRRRIQRRLSMAFLAVAIATAAYSLGIHQGRQQAIVHVASAQPQDAYQFFDTLVDLRSQIIRNYVEPVDEQKLQHGAIQGMLNELDPFSNYFSKDELASFDKLTHGQFSGIGAELSQDPTTGDLIIVSPLEDSPALKAGIQAGDRILKADGESTDGLSLKDLLTKVSGTPGSSVTLTVVHEGQKTPVDITVQRAVISVGSVRGSARADDGSWNFVLDPDHRIAYVRISSFMESTADDLDKALLPLLNSPQGLKGIILDLRYNPGGLLSQAVEVSNRFIDSGTIVSTRGRDGKSQYVAEAVKDKAYPGKVPLVILINEYSASASEIVAGCLKDHGRAVLIGTRSFGKGSVQNLITLDGGESALKLTTAHYYLPSGRNIMRKKGATTWGVEPDPAFILPLTKEENEAVLKARAKSEIIRPRRVSTQAATQNGFPNASQASSPPPGSQITGETPDRQLQRALEVLVAYQAFNGSPPPSATDVSTTHPSVNASLPTTAPATSPATQP